MVREAECYCLLAHILIQKWCRIARKIALKAADAKQARVIKRVPNTMQESNVKNSASACGHARHANILFLVGMILSLILCNMYSRVRNDEKRTERKINTIVQLWIVLKNVIIISNPHMSYLSEKEAKIETMRGKRCLLCECISLTKNVVFCVSACCYLCVYYIV